MTDSTALEQVSELIKLQHLDSGKNSSKNLSFSFYTTVSETGYF